MMMRFAFLLAAVATMYSLLILVVPAPGHADAQIASPFVTEIPHGYPDWRWISSAHEEGSLHSHYRHVPSEENNKVFGQAQSFVPGSPTNIQFMVKDSVKYAATGGWGFGHFGTDGKPGNAALMKTCFPCHDKTQATDLVFTRYAP